MTLAVMILALAMQHPEWPSCSLGDYHYAPSTKEQCKKAGGTFKYGEQPATRSAAPNPEPMDVPAVQEQAEPGKPAEYETVENGTIWHHHNPRNWTCTDKSRILLTSEDGKKHCILFPRAK